jgi:hypothetical protein
MMMEPGKILGEAEANRPISLLPILPKLTPSLKRKNWCKRINLFSGKKSLDSRPTSLKKLLKGNECTLLFLLTLQSCAP